MQKHNKNFEVKIINEEKNSRIKTKNLLEKIQKKKKHIQVVHLLHCSYLYASRLQTSSE